jgi:hypothetical protein
MPSCQECFPVLRLARSCLMVVNARAMARFALCGLAVDAESWHKLLPAELELDLFDCRVAPFRTEAAFQIMTGSNYRTQVTSAPPSERRSSGPRSTAQPPDSRLRTAAVIKRYGSLPFTSIFPAIP